MRIDRSLNLVVDLPRGEEPSVYAHSSALPAAVVEQYHRLAGPTMNAILTRGYGYFGPRYAVSVMREVAEEQAIDRASSDSAAIEAAVKAAKARVDAFLIEIRRRTHVLGLTENGWEMLPVADAAKSGTIDDEEVSEIENAIVYFTFGLRSWVKAQRLAVSGGLEMFNARIELRNCTDFMSFLQTSTKDVSSGESPDASQTSSHGSQGRDSSNSSHASASLGLALPRIAIVS